MTKHKSFNDRPLYVGDAIICIVGKHLKDAIITEIIENDWRASVKVKGIKSEIPFNKIVKI